MSVTTQFLVLLFSLILLHKSVALTIHISPISQVIVLGETATFHCSGSGDGFTVRIHIAPTTLFISKSDSEPELGIVVDIDNQGMAHTANITIEGREITNNTKIDCRVNNSPTQVIISSTATLTVIGQPDAVFNLNFPDQSVYVQMKQLLAIWSVPFTHENHSISSYNVSVSNTNTTESYQRSIAVESGSMSPTTESVTLNFPPLTSSCDILNVTVTAINDIGASEPVSASLFIPAVPDAEISVATTLLFRADGKPLFMLQIKFPTFCWFETLNYSVLLRHDEGEWVVVEESVLNPPEHVVHTITANIYADTVYYIVVQAETTVWSTVTSYNSSTHFNTTTASASTYRSTSYLTLGVTLGTTALLIVLVVCITVLVFSVRQKKKKTAAITVVASVQDLQVDRLQSTDPVYDDVAQYDTIGPSVNGTDGPSLNQPSIANGRSPCCENPTQKQEDHFNSLPLCQKDIDDCYILMNACK